MIVYKVVNKNYSSCIVTSVKFRLKYGIGRKTFPRVGKIFAFEGFYDAKHFANSTDRILRCEAKKSNRNTYGYTARWDSGKFIERSWEKEFLYTYYNGTLPAGTVLCDHVTPIEEIKW